MPAFLNLGAATYLKIYKTRNVLTGPELASFKKRNKIGIECTDEIVREIRFDEASEQTKSLMEKLLQPQKNQIFVIMKMGDSRLDSAYQNVIKPLGEEFGYKVLRVDEIQDSGMINKQILESIVESEIVLADLTGGRPNCYYETGVAHATGKELVLIITKGEKKHFDLAGNRFIEWSTENSLRAKLRRRFVAIQARN
jgi:nucleoside 2-deoxyribosyltransferase